MSRRVVVGEDGSIAVDGTRIENMGRDDLLALARDLATDLLASDTESIILRAGISHGYARVGLHRGE